ncbi:MAG: hypothetical protein MUE68_10915 [Bacteroidetes bacterium]|jgi:tetratricopeptide (TPR) repeat protein|nr:hypothetical protein [Bacteroidota bacterium]
MTRSERLSLVLLLTLFAVAGWLRLNDLSLYTDSTRYVIWAESLSRGLGWNDATQPVPEAYVVNAPFYPVLIVPSQWFASGSLFAAKVLTLLYGLGALALFLQWLRTWLPPKTAHLLTWLFGITPLTLVMFTEALSEAPFFLLLFLALWLRERDQRDPLTPIATAGLLATLSALPLLREISVAVVGAFVVDALLRRRHRLALAIGLAAAGTLGIWTLRNMVWVGVPESSQATNIQFVFEHFVTPSSAPIWQEWLQRFIINLRSYQFELSGMILVPFPLNLIRDASDVFVGIVFVLNAVKGWTGLLFLPLVLVGLWTDARTSPTAAVRILFVAFYAGIILLYPLQDIRFFLPAMPFVLIWLAVGLERVVRSLPRGKSLIVGSAVGILALLNLSAVLELVASNQRYRASVDAHRAGAAAFRSAGYYATPWELAGEALSRATPPEIVVASASKEIVPFVEGRKVLEVNRAVPLPMFESMLREHDVRVLLVQQVRSGIRSHEIQIVESRRFQYDTIATAGWLTAYRVRSRLREGLEARPFQSDQLDGVLSLLHEGRRNIHAARYHEADSVLALAQALDPINVEIAFQRVTSAALSGSVHNAIAAQQRLFSTPRSTSYTPPGRVLLSLAQALDGASNGPAGTDRAHWFFQASRMAWDLGYHRQAMAFADSALRVDDRHFESLLWSMHYRFQTGDSIRARRDLASLRELDAANPVVLGFTAIDSLTHVMSRTASRVRRAGLELEISRTYEAIGLPEEALDMVDRAWLAAPAEARRRTAEILNGTGRTAGGQRYQAPS